MSLLGKMLGFGRNAHYDKGIRFFDQGLYEEAVAEFELTRHAKSGKVDSLTERLSAFYTAESYAHLGHAALKQEQWSRAETCFARALAVHPHYADLHFYYALAIRAGGRYLEARDAMQKALDINPRFAKARFYAGLIAYEVGEREEGLHALNCAIELEPGFRTETFACAMDHHESEDYDAALQAFAQVSLTEVDDILFHYKLADDMYRRGMYAEAIGEYRKALELNPNYADIRNHLGITYSACGKSAEAISEFRSALQINPRFVDAMVNLALCLRETGASDEAASHFSRALELEPDNVIARSHVCDESAYASRRAA